LCNYKTIDVKNIEETVASMFSNANINLDESVLNCYKQALKTETNQNAINFYNLLNENSDIAKTTKVPLCQDTGLAVLFVDVGQDIIFKNGNLEQAINNGVEKGVKIGHLRASVVKNPIFDRTNTNNSAPAIIHYNVVPGNKLTLNLMAKGGGSENKSRLKMFNPTATHDEIINFIVETAKIAGPDACPPFFVGVGIGGNFEKCAILSKKALLLNPNYINPNKQIYNFEQKALKALNATNIGAMGLGGNTTAFSVKVLTAPCHIASLPIAINLNCHSSRHATYEL